jgi:sec-independent protein translocase protein TatB
MFVSTVRLQLSLAFMGPHPPILLGTLGMSDSLILMVMALVVFGPRRLPQIGRQVGKLMYEFRKASNDFKFQMEEELRNAEEADRRKKEEERQRSLAALAAAEQASVSADPPAKAPELPPPAVSAEPVLNPYDLSDASASSESVPRIMPPSTGETVAAARPGRTPETASEISAESSPAIPPSVNTEESQAPVSHAADPAEALNHHG